jgi:membrane protease YdiL (CAAX protease family)
MQVITESNFKKTSPIIYALAVPIGIAGFFLTIVISGIWQLIIIGFGYNAPGSGIAESVPPAFNIGIFILALVLTAVLPALCEEFAIRGIFLTAMRHTFLNFTLIIIMALSFGLFHQNITQMVYTAVSGGLMAFLVIKSRSIWPAVIIHFANNFLAVLWDYGGTYGWAGGLVDRLWDMIVGIGVVSMVFTAALSLAVIIPCVYLIIRQSKKDKLETPVEKIYKPTLRESAFLIGALVLTVLSTVITFAFRY